MSRATKLANQKPRLISLGLIILCLWLIGGILFPVSGERLGTRTLQLANNEVSASDQYFLSFDFVSASTVGSIRVEFCANDPLPGTPCTAPTGMDTTGATLISQTGTGGFSVNSGSTANEIILGRTPALAPVSTATFTFTGIVNPSVEGPYYARLQTFASSDGTGTYSDYGGIAFLITSSPSVTATVPPYLTFCTGITINGLDCQDITGDFIDFGELSSKQTRSGTSQMLIATNAALGYNVTYGGTTLTSGNNIITALASNDVSRPGVGQFGFNLRANSVPQKGADVTGPGLSTPEPAYSVPDQYRFVDSDMVVEYPQPDDVRKYTATYIANVPNNQAAGIYVSTITYVCLANF
jgi:hypothetical protein